MCVFFGHNQNSNIVFPLLLPRQLFRPCFLHSFSFHYCFRFHEAFVFFSSSSHFLFIFRFFCLHLPLFMSFLSLSLVSFRYYAYLWLIARSLCGVILLIFILSTYSLFSLRQLKCLLFFQFNFVVSHNLFVSFHLVCCSIYFSFIWLPLCTRLLVFGLVQFM